MVATISPAGDNFEETLSTLRYADRAKRIINHAVVNEDPNARIIRELRAEVDALKEMLKHATVILNNFLSPSNCHLLKFLLFYFQQPEVLKEKLSENEKLMKEMSLTWEEKLTKTGQTQEDRRQALEKLGISVQSSGIKVEKNKCFLVNLNSDPSLNEMLVYYIKDNQSLVGRTGATSEPDIQLSGVGIQDEHCEINVDPNNWTVTATPLSGARTCINGIEVSDPIELQNGDRILWGSNHFFRLNCPTNSSKHSSIIGNFWSFFENHYSVAAGNSDPTTPAIPFDWKMAQEEVMQADMSNDPIQDAIARLERQYEEDKQSALEKQRQEYEKHFQHLKSYMSPATPYAPYVPYDPFLRMGSKMTPTTPTVMSRLEKWGQERYLKKHPVSIMMHIMLRDLLTQKSVNQQMVTIFGYPRACRFRKYQFENNSWELPLPIFFKT
jgi:kinesin family protein 13